MSSGVLALVVSLRLLMIKLIACIRRQTPHFAAARADDPRRMRHAPDAVPRGAASSQ